MPFPHDLHQIICQTLGVEPTSMIPTGSPYAWLLDVNDQQLVAKTSPAARPTSALVEAWAYQECRRRGIRVPNVIAISQDPACVIVDILPGQSLWSESRHTQYDQLWSTLRCRATIQLKKA